MIISVVEDGTVEVLDSIDTALQHDAWDVESGVFHFYDEEGRWLRPNFSQPNRTWLLGLIVTRGVFSLELAGSNSRDDVDPLPLALAEAHTLKPNRHFGSLAEIRKRFGSPTLPGQPVDDHE